MAGGEKKRVSEVERERGQVQQMKLEPMAFSGEPASGELQHKELSKQENPIVGEEVEDAEYEGEMEKFVAGFIGGKRVYGTVSNAAIELLKKFENPPVDDDGKVGLHLPGDGTITYGYGIVVGRGDEISDELRQKYPPMSEEDATAQLRAAVAERARYVSNKLANRGLRATQQEFDAFVLDEYQSGDSSPLMERAQSLETLEELIQLFQRPSTIYPGLLKRREAEARVYFEGDYSENFSY